MVGFNSKLIKWLTLSMDQQGDKNRLIFLQTEFFPKFPKQRDLRQVILSQARQFRSCPPVSSCLVSTKTRPGMQTLNNYKYLRYDVDEKRRLQSTRKNAMVDVDHQHKKFNFIRMRIVIFFTIQLVLKRAVEVNRRPDFSFLPGRQWTSILLHFSSRPYLTLTKFIELVDCVFFRKVSFLMISLNLSSL